MGLGSVGERGTEGAASGAVGGLSAAELARHDREEEGAGQDYGAPMVQVVFCPCEPFHSSSACSDCKPLASTKCA